MIPLDEAHTILVSFGITQSSPEYERWVKADGFEEDDFISILSESKYLFILDWRGCLAEELENMTTTLNSLGAALQVESSSDEGDTASVTLEGKSVQLSYAPNEEQTSWLTVIQGLQAILPANLEFRESVHNGDSDTDVYAVLPKKEWDELGRNASESIQSLFRPLGSG
jgi:hypothetical protein